MDVQDKRQARGRFHWVRRLVQGQNKLENTQLHPVHRDISQHKQRHNQEATRSLLSERSIDMNSDTESMSLHSDNISTVPLKLIISRGSTTASPSVLSGENNQDNMSLVASTAETSIAPSTHLSIAPSTYGHLRSERERERDSELIITLASSTRRIRRRSIDTNCSLAGIAPASIMERLPVSSSQRGPDENEAQ